MNDTGVPMPEFGAVNPKIVKIETPEPILTLEQRQRVEALQVARQTLENKPGLFVSSKLEPNRAVYDLTYLADWILDGPTVEDDEPNDLRWARRQGYTEGVEASALVSEAGGDANRIRSLLESEADVELRAARSDADDGV